MNEEMIEWEDYEYLLDHCLDALHETGLIIHRPTFEFWRYWQDEEGLYPLTWVEFDILLKSADERIRARVAYEMASKCWALDAPIPEREFEVELAPEAVLEPWTPVGADVLAYHEETLQSGG